MEGDLHRDLTARPGNGHHVIDVLSAPSASDSPAFRCRAELIVEGDMPHHRRFAENANEWRFEIDSHPVGASGAYAGRAGVDQRRPVNVTGEPADGDRRDGQELHGVAEPLRDMKQPTLRACPGVADGGRLGHPHSQVRRLSRSLMARTAELSARDG
ncbi:MAG: hypothetical protein M3083_13210 [Actinomycetota bacterium]|nr:hypothetical protein [Actinomycetota bacterium]MDQ6947583.1 hypothetical protein [Actinomycetota bacterium]